MKKLFLTLFIIQYSLFSLFAQTVTIYRGGVATSPTYSKVKDANLASLDGDSIVLSAHTFKEHDIPLNPGRVWKGTMTTTDTSTIDAQYISGFSTPVVRTGVIKNIVLRDIIFTNGEGYGLAPGNGTDSLMLKGYTIVRNSRTYYGVGVLLYKAFLYDHVNIYNNSNDSFGGVGKEIWAFDSVEIHHNSAAYGGVVGGQVSPIGFFYCNSPSVRIHHNTATIGGGAIYGYFKITAGQITDNQSPKGAAIFTYQCGANLLQNTRIYNPRPDGTRQLEIYHRSGSLNIDGSWFGQNDTTGLIQIGNEIPLCTSLSGRPAKANWSVNWGKALSKKDTLFPIGAGFTYRDGTPLPPNSCPWLVGNFSSSTGTFLTSKPIMKPNDTLSSLFRTYIYATKGDTSNKPISYVCSIDADTFRITPLVWGRDTNKVNSIATFRESQVLVYPNPAKDVLHIQGIEVASVLMLYDVAGKLIKQEEAKSNDVSIDVKDVASGIYQLKITSPSGGEGSAKVMKE